MDYATLNDVKGNELEIIEFYIEENMPDGTVYRGYYGMNVAKVLEIIRYPVVTAVPSKHHPAVLGTFNLRGRVLPLVNLAKWLGKELVDTETLKVIVSEYSGKVTAFLCSGVTRIHHMTWAQVEAPDKYLRSYSQDSITGVIRFEDRIMFILDMEMITDSMDTHSNMASQLKKMDDEEYALHVPDADKFHVLVADDSLSVRNMVDSMLTRVGYKVTKVSSGMEAWKTLTDWQEEAATQNKTIEDVVHMVISDIEMPEMDGHTLTRKIKGDSGLAVLPVVLFSSLITDALHDRGIKAGADAQISKPDLPTLTQKVRTIIKDKLGR